MIELGKDDLLKADAQALVNTVNCVGVMGKGIALQFKKAFPANFAVYEKACKRGDVKLGHMLVFSTGQVFNPRFIINFPTKDHWKGKSKIRDIESGLNDLVHQIRELGITSVAVPPLGCGNGGLIWRDVKPLIERAFAQIPDVRVLVYEPQGAPLPETMVVNTRTPNMTAGRAAVIKLFAAYLNLDYGVRISQLVANKLSYFLQEFGEPLKLHFEKNRYGPYADDLRHVLTGIEKHFIVGYGDGTDMDCDIRLLPGAEEEATAALPSETAERIYKVMNLISGYHSPYSLELLSTVHWVAVRDPRAADSYSYVVTGVTEWSERKKELFSPGDIRMAWSHLHEAGLLSKPGPPESKFGNGYKRINWSY